jgi:Na+-translocating ferredoxin:NAD+ oxidoreductase subunit C
MTAFKGGVHPLDSKGLSAHAPITVLDPPDTIIVPLQQHLGAPCKAVVKLHQEVTTGQLIGEPQGRVSAPVHAPLAGTVKSIGRMPHPSGRKIESIVINVAPEQPDWPWQTKVPPTTGSEVVLQAIADAGIVGMGGAGFPTNVKLAPPPGKTIDTVILNGCECEPYLTADHRLMAEDSERIANGLVYIMQALGIDHGIVALEDNKPDAEAALMKVNWPDGVAVKVLPTHYPQGAEKMLIQACVGRKVPSGGLPMDVGVVVHNVATAAAIADAVEYGMPLIRRVVTLTGGGVVTPGNYLVPLGMRVRDFIAAAGGLKDEAAALIFGGPMMGVTQPDMDTAITKTTSGIIALTEDEIGLDSTSNCIRCGKCVDACPMGLLPSRLEKVVHAGRIDVMEQYNILDCIECGSCSYVCPAHRPLVALIRLGKGEVTAARRSAA